jgi:hypothetical protein
MTPAQPDPTNSTASLSKAVTQLNPDLAVSLAALGSGYLASAFGLRSAPLAIGGISALAGLFLSAFAVRERLDHVRQEAKAQPMSTQTGTSSGSRTGRTGHSSR